MAGPWQPDRLPSHAIPNPGHWLELPRPFGTKDFAERTWVHALAHPLAGSRKGWPTAEGGPIELGENDVIMGSAVLRGARQDPLRLGAHCLAGSRAYLAGATTGSSLR